MSGIGGVKSAASSRGVLALKQRHRICGRIEAEFSKALLGPFCALHHADWRRDVEEFDRIVEMSGRASAAPARRRDSSRHGPPARVNVHAQSR